MSAEAGPWWARLIIVLFAAGVVAIAGHQISVQYVGKKTSPTGAKGKALVQELHGEVDVAKASVSPEYVEQYVQGAKAKDDTQSASAHDPKEQKGTKTLDKKALGSLLDKLAP